MKTSTKYHVLASLYSLPYLLILVPLAIIEDATNRITRMVMGWISGHALVRWSRRARLRYYRALWRETLALRDSAMAQHRLGMIPRETLIRRWQRYVVTAAAIPKEKRA